jgi:hypothetical protein
MHATLPAFRLCRRRGGRHLSPECSQVRHRESLEERASFASPCKGNNQGDCKISQNVAINNRKHWLRLAPAKAALSHTARVYPTFSRSSRKCFPTNLFLANPDGIYTRPKLGLVYMPSGPKVGSRFSSQAVFFSIPKTLCRCHLRLGHFCESSFWKYMVLVDIFYFQGCRGRRPIRACVGCLGVTRAPPARTASSRIPPGQEIRSALAAHESINNDPFFRQATFIEGGNEVRICSEHCNKPHKPDIFRLLQMKIKDQ